MLRKSEASSCCTTTASGCCLSLPLVCRDVFVLLWREGKTASNLSLSHFSSPDMQTSQTWLLMRLSRWQSSITSITQTLVVAYCRYTSYFGVEETEADSVSTVLSSSFVLSTHSCTLSFCYLLLNPILKLEHTLISSSFVVMSWPTLVAPLSPAHLQFKVALVVNGFSMQIWEYCVVRLPALSLSSITFVS